MKGIHVSTSIGPSALSPAVTSAELADLDRRHVIHPLQMSVFPERLVIVRGRGCAVWDADGNEYLDATGGGLWHSHVGHGRRELAEAAAAQMQELEYFTNYQEFANDKTIRLAARLAELAPSDVNRSFFTSGGSDSVESAIKVARLYHQRTGQPDRTWIISRHFGFHGSNYGSGTATGFDTFHAGVGPHLPHVAKVSPPYLYRAAELYGDADPTEFLIRELDTTIREIGPGNVAAMIGEPVMGGGGVLTPPADYWPRVRALLDFYGILLIADEVITAFGRTGAWFDSEQRGMDPDIITVAKGITSGYFAFGATMMRDRIGEAISEEMGFFHGYTFSGHPTGSAVALANLDLMEKEHLPANALAIGDRFRTGLAPLADVATVGDVRVEGAAAAIEMIAGEGDTTPMAFPAVFAATARIRAEHGIIARPYAHNIILSPPLTMTEEEVSRTCAAIVSVLRDGPTG